MVAAAGATVAAAVVGTAAVAGATVVVVGGGVVVDRLSSVLGTGTAHSATPTALPASQTASDAKHPSRGCTWDHAQGRMVTLSAHIDN